MHAGGPPRSGIGCSVIRMLTGIALANPSI
jgi:hypothetical protein